MIEPSPHDADVAYLAIDRHKLDDIKAYAWKTADRGKTWTRITVGLPDGAVVHAVREDPARRGLPYAGTERGVFVSFDDGAQWQSLQLNLPPSPIHDLLVKGDDLVVATHGRSFWILDDVTPLRQIDAAMAGQDVVLFKPQTALRLSYPDEVNARRPVGINPPAGALIDYALKTGSKDEITLDILDAQGKLMRHLSSTRTTKEVQPPEWPDQIVPNDKIPAGAGMNRLVWDLRMADPEQVPGAFYAGLPPRGPRVAPGQYTVKLTVAGKTYEQPLTMQVDPRSAGNAEAIRAKIDLQLAVVHDIDRLHHAVNEIRKTREQLQKSSPPDTKHLSALDPIEQTLIQVNMKGSEANLAFPGMLNEQLATFAATQDDADMPPTRQHRAMFESLHAQLQAQLAKWGALRTAPAAAEAGAR
jgi:hypothetical protein